MKIALIGYGKMGKAIEQIAMEKGHEIVLRIGSSNVHDFTKEKIKSADVAIEFSTPETAFKNVLFCLENNIPTVCGSTAWLANLEEAKAATIANETSFIFASNFSIGVNIFFAVNKYLATVMNGQPQYDVNMEEIHHTAKLDAPSGTAVTLAEGILQHVNRKIEWVNANSNDSSKLNIISKRIDPAPGTHLVNYISKVDDITITHTAHNRIGFASGAVMAAEYIIDKKGIFTMQEVLGL
jgi:4-hydroxy-tetrahydrodipicolinate reductase